MTPEIKAKSFCLNDIHSVNVFPQHCTIKMNSDVDMKDVELSELDTEKQPMAADGQAGSGEKNGSVKVKIPKDEVAFTGLSKEELMKVAGTPG